jgi:hypothetical protein
MPEPGAELTLSFGTDVGPEGDELCWLEPGLGEAELPKHPAVSTTRTTVVAATVKRWCISTFSFSLC